MKTKLVFADPARLLSVWNWALYTWERPRDVTELITPRVDTDVASDLRLRIKGVGS